MGLAEDGFAIARSVVDEDICAGIAAKLKDPNTAGARNLLRKDWCASLARALRTHAAIRDSLPSQTVAVQCTLFDKSADKNWLVTLHQDLSVPVFGRIDAPGFSGWSEKEGQLYVQPPREVLESLIGVRLHLDDCGIENGPLRVVPGSHRNGRLSGDEARAMRERNGEVSCLVPKGGVLILRPLLLHSSSKATSPSHRRVLHFLFAPARAPRGLKWAEAV
jgi:ectoine hydroxylase-related dioxygenase (phytanoyl-CoA dioxygenase family)